MQGILIALEALNGLLVAVGSAGPAISTIQGILGQAHAEGRDLTDQEVQQAIDARKAAEATLQATLQARPAPAAPNQQP